MDKLMVCADNLEHEIERTNSKKIDFICDIKNVAVLNITILKIQNFSMHLPYADF